MLRNKEKKLVLDFDIFRGLILKWNLVAGEGTNYLRHMVIFDVRREYDFSGFSTKYFHKIKQGDMITFACINEDEEFFILKWRQKSPITQLQLNRLKPSPSSLQNIYKLFDFIETRTQQFTQPIVFNIVTEKTGKELKKLHSFLKTFKSKGQRFLINIFCDGQTSIQPNIGVNWLNLNEFGEEFEQNWNFLKLYLNQISLIKIKITIQCENGIFSSKKEDEWSTVDFNKISRQIYAPTLNYAQDVIQFINEDPTSQIKYNLNINLQFTELDNQVYYANKKVNISAMSQKVYQRTFAGREVEYAVEMYPGFYSRKNPFRSESLVWFKKCADNGSV